MSSVLQFLGELRLQFLLPECTFDKLDEGQHYYFTLNFWIAKDEKLADVEPFLCTVCLLKTQLAYAVD